MRLYGLIGYPLSHSFSEKYFSEKFRKEHIGDGEYRLFPLEDIRRLPALVASHPNLKGLNVTIPHKRSVIAFLDQHFLPGGLEACNCIRIDDGKFIGYNTDVVGFEKSLLPILQPHHQRALVLGTGGAAAAVVYVLKRLGIDVTMVSRSGNGNPITYNDLTGTIIQEHTLIINTTPVGMYPDTNECPDIPFEAIGPQHLLYDLIYNPAKTLFLQQGESRGAIIKNGEEMLVLQAEESWRIWNGKEL